MVPSLLLHLGLNPHCPNNRPNFQPLISHVLTCRDVMTQRKKWAELQNGDCDDHNG